MQAYSCETCRDTYYVFWMQSEQASQLEIWHGFFACCLIHITMCAVWLAQASEPGSQTPLGSQATVDAQQALLRCFVPYGRVVAFIWACIRHIVPAVRAPSLMFPLSDTPNIMILSLSAPAEHCADLPNDACQYVSKTANPASDPRHGWTALSRAYFDASTSLATLRSCWAAPGTGACCAPRSAAWCACASTSR